MTKTRTWALLALVVALTAAMFAAGCGSSDDTSSTTGNSGSTASGGDIDLSGVTLLKDGTLTVGSDIPFPPFEQGDPPDYEGFDIDLINAVADKMGLTTSIQDAPFNLLLSGGGGQFDLAIAATTITPERAQKVDFSDPYFDAEQGLLVPDGSDIQTVDDLSGKIVGAQDGTTGETYAQDNTDASEVRPFPQIDDAYNALKNGQVDAVLNDLPSVQAAAKQLGGLEVVQDFPTDEQYGIYAQKGAPIIPAVNEALQQVKDDGTLQELYQKWFKIDAPKDLLQPGPAAALSASGG
jgi:polar amino acid transport system substrate-binding protein